MRGRLGALIRRERQRQNLTQAQLAVLMDCSVDTVQRLEKDKIPLPKSPRQNDSIANAIRALGLDLHQVIAECFTDDEIASSVYADRVSPAHQTATSSALAAVPSLEAFFASVANRTPSEHPAGLSNARAMAALVALERQYSAFEFLVSNQPPFVLFADEEYVTRGSSSLELDESDRATYHSMIFEHQAWARAAVASGQRRHQVVLNFEQTVRFLRVRDVDRAQATCADLLAFLHYPNFSLTVMDGEDKFREFEVLSSSYPFVEGEPEAVSIRHRRVYSQSNTAAYELHLTITPALVAADYGEASALWATSVRNAQFGRTFERHTSTFLAQRDQIAAEALLAALESSHPGAAEGVPVVGPPG